MNDMPSDEQVIRQAYEAYDDELTDLVPKFVTPEEHVESEEAEAWGVQVFQFGFALGAVTGASIAEREDEVESAEGEGDVESAEGEVGFTEDRVEDLVDTTVGIIGELDVYSEDHFRQ